MGLSEPFCERGASQSPPDTHNGYYATIVTDDCRGFISWRVNNEANLQ